MVLLEAMLARVPIIASAVGGIPDMLSNGNAGILIEPGNPEEIVEGISRLLYETNLRVGFTDFAHNKVCDEYSDVSMARRYVELYTRLVNTT